MRCAKEAIRMCDAIVLRLGEDEAFNRVYDDGKIRVIRSMYSREMTVVLFPPFTGATTGNPALMVDENGECFRFHGEMRRATRHITDLFRTIPGNENYGKDS
jgi:hypothetical protein